jgi:hypothetical protein
MAKPTRPPNTTPFTQPSFYTGQHAAPVPRAQNTASGGLTVVGPGIASYRGEASVRLDFQVSGGKTVPLVFRCPRGGFLRNVSVTVHNQLPVKADIVVRRAPAGERGLTFQDYVTLEEMLDKQSAPAGYDVDFGVDEYRVNQGDTLAAQIEADGAFIDAAFTLFFSLQLDAE